MSAPGITIRKRYIGEKYRCAGVRVDYKTFRQGCGRVFIHSGPCPFCKLKTTKTYL